MYINRRFYIAVLLVVFCFISGFKSPFLFTLALFLLLGLILIIAYEAFLLYNKNSKVSAVRVCEDRFSNGDENEIQIHIDSTFPFSVNLEVIDEIPDVFQYRKTLFKLSLEAKESKRLTYQLRPVKRGAYHFGLINVFVSTRIGLINRKFKTGSPYSVKVYPSYLRLRQYELMAISNKLTASGMKKIRRIGQQLELEHIKEYVKGDDYRTINWKATARRSQLMVNIFQDERAQNVYNLIDKGRTMQSASNRMTLLDYSINASLALSFVSMIKGDKAGLLTFEKKYETILPASRHADQMHQILDALYKQQTTFAETDYSSLYACVKKNITQRSLLLVYSNFDTVKAMQRQLVYLRMLAKQHTVVVIFFENTGLSDLIEKEPVTKLETYEKVIAEKLVNEKRLIVRKLRQNNVLSILTSPEKLTTDVINKYLDLKARNMF